MFALKTGPWQVKKTRWNDEINSNSATNFTWSYLRLLNSTAAKNIAKTVRLPPSYSWCVTTSHFGFDAIKCTFFLTAYVLSFTIKLPAQDTMKTSEQRGQQKNPTKSRLQRLRLSIRRVLDWHFNTYFIVFLDA